jgi:hypothetical protein
MPPAAAPEKQSTTAFSPGIDAINEAPSIMMSVMTGTVCKRTIMFNPFKKNTFFIQGSENIAGPPQHQACYRLKILIAKS